MTRRRVRSWRPATPISLFRSTEPMTVSVTPLGSVMRSVSGLTPIWPAGHSPANAGAALARDSSARAARVADRNICWVLLRDRLSGGWKEDGPPSRRDPDLGDRGL